MHYLAGARLIKTYPCEHVPLLSTEIWARNAVRERRPSSTIRKHSHELGSSDIIRQLAHSVVYRSSSVNLIDDAVNDC